VAIYNDNLVGLKANVEAVVRGTLNLDVGPALPRTTVVGVSLINDSPVDYTLENIGNGFYFTSHHENGSLNVLNAQVVLASWGVVWSHDSDFLSSLDDS